MKRILIYLLLATTSVGFISCSSNRDIYQEKFTQLEPEWIVTPDEALEWAMVKENNLPTTFIARITTESEFFSFLSNLDNH